MTKRIKYLDGLRFFAIFSIVLLHVNSFFRNKYIQYSSIKFLILTFFDGFTRMGVPIFFMLTGVLMFTKKEKNNNYLEFLKKRVLRLVYAYFLFSLIYYVYLVIKQSEIISIYHMIEKITSSQTAYHLWFLPTIILIYMFIPFLKKLVKALSKKELFTLILIIIIFGNLFKVLNDFSNIYNHGVLANFTIPDLIIYTNYLFIGYYLHKYNVKINKKMLIVSMLSLIIIPFLTLLISKNSIINDMFLNSTSPFVILPSILTYLIFKNYYDKFKIPKPMDKFISENIGNIFYVYLWHVLVLLFIESKIDNFANNSNFFLDMFLTLIMFIFTIISSYILTIIWNKIKECLLKFELKLNKKNKLKK